MHGSRSMLSQIRTLSKWVGFHTLLPRGGNAIHGTRSMLFSSQDLVRMTGKSYDANMRGKHNIGSRRMLSHSLECKLLQVGTHPDMILHVARI